MRKKTSSLKSIFFYSAYLFRKDIPPKEGNRHIIHSTGQGAVRQPDPEGGEVRSRCHDARGIKHVPIEQSLQVNDLILMRDVIEKWDEAFAQGLENYPGRGRVEVTLLVERVGELLVFPPLFEVFNERRLAEKVEGLSELGPPLVDGELGVHDVVHVDWIACDQDVDVREPRRSEQNGAVVVC